MNDLLNTFVDAIDQFSDELIDLADDNTMFGPLLGEITYEHALH